MKKLLLLLPACAGVMMIAGCCLFRASETAPVNVDAWVYPSTAAFKRSMSMVKAKGIQLTDWHIHIRGGMTPQKAREREVLSGIRCAVLENTGREWPLSNNVALATFIADCKNVKGMKVGIQVNDRDWHALIDPALYAQLDFVLADTMIMGLTAEGKPRRLWLPDVKITDEEAWMEAYMRHNLRILDEPVSILANPTYLPPCIADQYDTLWTEERMRQIIAKAIANGVALEIQAESGFPKPSFIRLAKQMGAKFSFGTNNHDDKVKDLTAWFDAIEQAGLRASDIAPICKREL